MIDPLLSLAISVQSNKGVYALLLGSGISRASGIPTGWEVVLDLIRKVASAEGADCEPDPAAWYQATYSDQPDYATLLDAVAKSQPERMQLLRSYFEPNEDEREQGLKLPTVAHKAIAELVVGGYIRVIVTTNFDQLMEQALEAVGVVPTVLSTADAIAGAIPLVHLPCAVIKVHGDYLDPRIKNTPDELAAYEPSVIRLLDQVFDEYGLIVCGWSAESDTALRAAIERCPTRRFTTYWAAVGEPRDAAKQLIHRRRAELATIPNADAFFAALAEKVGALESLASSHPLSAKIAAETVKRFLVDDRYRIRLRDLVTGEVARLREALTTQHFPISPDSGVTGQTLYERILRYDAASEIIRDILITGCYFGEPKHDSVWVDCLQRAAQPVGADSGQSLTVLLSLRAYPALLLLYATGLAAISAGRYGTLRTLLVGTKVQTVRGRESAVLGLVPGRVLDRDNGRLMAGHDGQYMPMNEHLFSVLREPFKNYIPDDEAFDTTFDRFEYLSALVHWHEREKSRGSGAAPLGRFWWKVYSSHGESIMQTVEQELAAQGEQWDPLQAGLFDSSVETLRRVKMACDTYVQSQPPW